MKKTASAIAIAMGTSLFAPPASATDLRDVARTADAIPAISWTAFYVGAHGGWVWGEFDGRPVYDGGMGPVKGVFDRGQIEADGHLAGVTLGVQKQWERIVIGIEVDGSWGDVSGENTFNAKGASKGYHWTVDTGIDGLYTARARLGYAIGNLLIYGTGGLSVAQVSMDETVTADKIQGFPKDGTVTARASSDENMVGWVAGGGAEWGFAPGWSFKTEALYVDLGEIEHRFKGTAYPGTPGAFPHTTDSYDADLGLTIVRAGVNYRW